MRPIGKYRVDNQLHLDNFLTDVCSNECHIDAFVGDKPKRSEALCYKGHSAYFPCEYCESKGVLLNTQDNTLKLRKKELLNQLKVINNQIIIAQENNEEEQVTVFKKVLKTVNNDIKNLNRKHNNIVWPASTQNGPKRTVEKVREIVDRLENNDILSIDEAKGVTGHSLFLHIPYFNCTRDAPVEYLHGVCLCVVKRMIILTFNVGDVRQRNTTRRLSSPSIFNSFMALIKVPREFPRRARSLEYASLHPA